MSSVAIIALANWSQPQELADFDEVWTINNAHRIYGHKSDLIIAMDDFGRDWKTHESYVREMTESGIPILSTKADERWPTVTPYPIREVYNFLKAFWNEPNYLLDNSCNYAFAYALYRKIEKIGIFGFDWENQYRLIDLDCAMARWRSDGYDPPDWFKYYHPDVLARRRPSEPGVEAFHFLLAVAMSQGIQMCFAETTTIMNVDRDKFLYGYHEQPDVT